MLGDDAGGRLAGRLRDRRSRRRRSRLSRPVRAGERAGAAQAAPPCISRDGGLGRRITRRQSGHGRCAGALQGRRHRRADAPIPCQGRRGRGRDRPGARRSRCGSTPGSGAGRSIPTATATRARSAASCSTRLAEAEAMSLDDYRKDLAQRDKARALYAGAGGGMRRLRQPVGARGRAARSRIDRRSQLHRRMRRCSASRRSRFPCCRTRGCRSACK